MKAFNPLLGGIFLISGTTIGAGMLAFPTMTVFAGFFPSCVVFLLLWLLMLVTSFYFLDAHLAVTKEEGGRLVNMVTIADATLGPLGKAVCWIVYLLLLYSLTAAYIAGAAPLIKEAIDSFTHASLPTWLSLFALPILLCGFIYSGTREVDLVNRLLFLGLGFSYVLLTVFAAPHVKIARLKHTNFPAVAIAIPVVVTAFGYHIILPSLVTYLKRDVKKLRLAIVIGSSIPIFIYLLWQGLILGAVPFSLLHTAYLQGESATAPLALALENPWIFTSARLFAFFAIVTSFLGVTLSLADFLTDGLKIKKSRLGRLLAISLTFFPPLLFVFTYERSFYLALQHAGVFVAILLIFLPAAMVWKLKKYSTFMRRLFLVFVMLCGVGMVLLDIAETKGLLKQLIDHYNAL